MRLKSTPTKQPKPRGKAHSLSTEVGGGHQRQQRIMAEAAHLFATRGFDATTIRDIASAAGILGGSIYYHFASKEDIFVAVHKAGMEAITSAVLDNVARYTDPWDRLTAAAVAHCESLLSSSDLPVIVSPYYSRSLGALRKELIKERDRYEKIINGLVEDLNLPPQVDRTLFRLHFLGAMNWIPTWYTPHSRLTPADIGRQTVELLRWPKPK